MAESGRTAAAVPERKKKKTLKIRCMHSFGVLARELNCTDVSPPLPHRAECNSEMYEVTYRHL